MRATVHRVDGQGKPPLVGALLRRPFLHARAQIVRDLHASGFTQIHPAHLSVFQHPGPHERTPGELARAARMSKQAMNNLLTQLERDGYLVRTSHPTSGRERLVLLTDRGREAIDVIRVSVSALEASWRSALGARDYDQLRGFLERLNDELPDVE